MKPQSLEFLRTPGLPRYGDVDEFQPGVFYVFTKRENQKEPANNARAVHDAKDKRDAREWARRFLGADLFTIAHL